MEVIAKPQTAEKRHLISEPTSILGAQYSLPFNIAVALAKDISNPLVYDEETLWNPIIRDLAKKVEVHSDTDQFIRLADEISAKLVIKMAGENYTINAGDFKGSPRQPLNFDETGDKFQRNSHTMVDKTRGDKIQELVRHLEQLPDMKELASLIRPDK